jgi:hypothetical protein
VAAIQSNNRSQYRLSRLLIAYSGSIFPLRDQAEQLCRRITDSNQKRYRTKLQTDVDLQISDFLIELRNYVQHTHVSFLLTPENISPRYRIRGEAVPEGVYIHIDELRDRGRNFKKPKARAFLEEHKGDLIELEPLLQQYFNDCLTFNKWVGATYRQEKQESIEQTGKLIERLVEDV